MSRTAQHTPGPWTYKPAGCFVDSGGNPTTVPRVFTIPEIMGELRVGNGSPSCREADARLVAAAPAMLEAIKGAADALSSLAVSLPDGSEAQRYADDEARKLGALLARVLATGGDV